MKKALLVVDLQLDFINGSMAVPRAVEIVQPLLRLAEEVELVIATRDWHPADHCSFTAQGGPWPAHCVRGTEGAMVLPAMMQWCDMLISKGKRTNREEYSMFQTAGTFGPALESFGVPIIIGGLATEYCVRATVLDALKLGLEVEIHADLMRGVDEEDAESSVLEMFKAGATLCPLD